MAGLFGLGAFNTQVGQRIGRATDNGASAGDLHLHLQICDTINESNDGPKEAVAALKKRLSGSGKNYHQINLALTVLETCVKNCGHRFHCKIAQKDFLVELTKIIQKKNNPPPLVRDRILGLVQTWADAFRGKEDLAGVVDAYQQLKDEDWEFPPVDLDAMAPINTPTQRKNPDVSSTAQLQGTLSQSSSVQPGVSSSQQPPQQQLQPGQPLSAGQPGQPLSAGQPGQPPSAGQPGQPPSAGQPGQPPSAGQPGQPLSAGQPGQPPSAGQPGRSVISINQTQVAKIMSEVDAMRSNMAVLNEMMAEIEPGTANAGEKDLMYQLSVILQELQKRIGRLCQKVQDDMLLSTLLAANDEVNGVIIRYDRYSKNAAVLDTPVACTDPSATTTSATATASSQPSSQEVPKEPPPVYTETSDVPLIDLGEEITTPPAGHIEQLERDIANLDLEPLAPFPVVPSVQPTATSFQTEDDAEFDMFAQSRQTAYTVPSSSTYADQQSETNKSLSAALQKNPKTEQDSLDQLQEWLTFNSDTPSTTTEPQGVTSAEFDQFLNQRAQVDPTAQQPSRPRPQMQKQEEEDEGLFAL